MADQELTALKIRIEANIADAIKQLDNLASAVTNVSKTVEDSVGRINGAFATITSSVKGSVDGAKKELDKLSKTKVKAPDVDTSDTIKGLQEELSRLKDKRAVVKISADQSGLLQISDEIAKVEFQLKSLTNTKILPVIDRASLDQFVAELQAGVDVSINELKAFKAEADRQLNIAPRVDRTELANISRYLSEEILKASNAAVIKPTLDLSGISNVAFNNLKVGAEVNLDDLVKAKKYFEDQRLLLTTDADISAVNEKLKLITAEIERKKTLTLDANVAPAQNKINSLKVVNSVVLGIDVSLDELQQVKNELKRTRLTVVGDLETAELNRKLDVVEAEILRLQKLKINPVSPGVATSVGAVGNSLRGISPVGDKATQTLKSFEQVIRDGPSFAYSFSQGLIAISNNIGPLTDSLRDLGTRAKESGQSVGSALLAAVKSPVGITVGISAAVTALTILVSKYQQAGSAAKELGKETDEAKEALEGILSTIGSEAAQIVSLVGFIEKETTSREEKGAALKKLSGINQQYFGELKNEEGLIQSLSISYRAYINSLLETAKSKVIIDKLGDSFKKLADLQLSIDPEFQSIDINSNIAANNGRALIQAYGGSIKKNFAGELPGLKKYVGGNLSTTFNDINKEITKEFQIGTRGINLESTNIFDLSKTNRQIDRELNKIDFLSQFAKKFASFSSLDLSLPEGAGGALKDFFGDVLQAEKELQEKRLANIEIFNKKYVDQFSALGKKLSAEDVLKRQKDILDIELEIKLRGIDPNSPFKAKLRELYIAQAQEELKKLEIEATDTIIKQGTATLDVEDFNKSLAFQREQIRKAGATGRGTLKPLSLALPTDVFDNQVNVAISKIEELRGKLGLQIAPEGFWESLLPPTDDFATETEAQATQLTRLRDIMKTFAGQIDEATKAAKEFNDQLAQVIATGIAEFLGDVMDKAKEGTLTWETLSESLRDFIFDITKAVAKLVVMNAILKALKITTPVGGATGGFGLLGALFPKLFGGARPFATGGIVTGPTFGMIGEAGTEAVLPLSYLNNLLNTTGGGGTLSARVSGDDLLFLVEKAGTKKNRYF